MDAGQAISYLIRQLPGFKELLTFRDEPEALLHPTMGDLGRYYMAKARTDADLTRSYWGAVERLAADGDDEVKNAVHASLIQWFAHGTEGERRALAEAEPVQGPATRAIVSCYRPHL